MITVSAGVGCGVNTYSTGEPRSNVPLDSRAIRDPGLASDIRIEATRLVNRSASKLAQLTLRNVGSSSHKIDVQFVWFDADQVRLSGSQVPWETVSIAPGETREVTSLGIPQATDFRVTIRNQ